MKTLTFYTNLWIASVVFISMRIQSLFGFRLGSGAKRYTYHSIRCVMKNRPRLSGDTVIHRWPDLSGGFILLSGGRTSDPIYLCECSDPLHLCVSRMKKSEKKKLFYSLERNFYTHFKIMLLCYVLILK